LKRYICIIKYCMMNYNFYTDYSNVPKNTLQELGKKLYKTDNFTSFSFEQDLLKGFDTDKCVMLFVTKNKKLVSTFGIVYIPANVKKMMGLKYSEKTYQVKNVFVVPEFRGKGMCKKMTNKMTWYVSKHNIARRLKLDVEENNTPAIRCYTSAGYHQTSDIIAQKWLDKNFAKFYGFQPNNRVLIYSIVIRKKI